MKTVADPNTPPVPKCASWAALPIRLVVGYGLLVHGFAKLIHGPEHFIAILHAIGVPAPSFMGWMTILVEIAGGIAVLAGAFVPWVSIVLAAVLITAAISVHLQYGFSSIKLLSFGSGGAHFGPPGYETDLLYLACLATLVLGGPGPFSVDKCRARTTHRENIERTGISPGAAAETDLARI